MGPCCPHERFVAEEKEDENNLQRRGPVSLTLQRKKRKTSNGEEGYVSLVVPSTAIYWSKGEKGKGRREIPSTNNKRGHYPIFFRLWERGSVSLDSV